MTTMKYDKWALLFRLILSCLKFYMVFETKAFDTYFSYSEKQCGYTSFQNRIVAYQNWDK